MGSGTWGSGTSTTEPGSFQTDAATLVATSSSAGASTIGGTVCNCDGGGDDGALSAICFGGASSVVVGCSAGAALSPTSDILSQAGISSPPVAVINVPALSAVVIIFCVFNEISLGVSSKAITKSKVNVQV